MPNNLFAGINLALRAVLAHQQAMQVIEHNVANVNTRGYRRQEAVLTAGIPYAPASMSRDSYPGQMGQGVQVDRIRRFHLEFFDTRYRGEISEQKRGEASQTVLQQLEATLAETSTDGLAPKLDAFWEGWQTLTTDPANLALRGDLRERAAGLAEAFQRRAQSLRDLRSDQDLAVKQSVQDVNEMATHVARLNAEIARVKSVGDDPNDLLDERDRVLDSLAEVTGAISYTEQNGETTVSINGHALVVGNTTFQLTTVVANNPPPTPAATPGQNLSQVQWADGMTFSAARGELAGLLDARDRVIPNQQIALDATATELANRVNAFHAAGRGLPPVNSTVGTPPGYTGNFFDTTGVGGAALSIRLDSFIDSVAGLNYIAAASAPDAPGDSSNALNIANLAGGLFMNGGTATIGGYYIAQVGTVALELQTVTNATNDRKLVAGSLDKQRESVGGVSLDEEAAKLVQTQRAYEAAARMLTTVDQMLDKIINGMGLVGR